MSENRFNMRWRRNGSTQWTKTTHAGLLLDGWMRGEVGFAPLCDGNVILGTYKGDEVEQTEDRVTCRRCLRILGQPILPRENVQQRDSSTGTFYFSEDGMILHREHQHGRYVPDGVGTRKDGSTWTKYRRDVKPVKAPEPFYAEMLIKGTSSGRSTKWFNVVDTETGVRYPMATSEMLKIMQSVGIQPGGIIPRGRWVFVKKGTAGGIGLDISQYESSEDVDE